MFSSRLPPSLAENRISRALGAARQRGQPLCDLTESNPTVVGLRYPAERILSALADPRALTYEPTPKGLAAARQAVADYYARLGQRVDPERITLTASTSEAYSLAFKLLCDPGQSVLAPQPSYPLFEHLAALDGVRLGAYPLRYHGGWYLDVDELAAALAPDTRAILVVNPNNPTGSYLKRAEWARLEALCAERQLAIVSDEVFADYADGEDRERMVTLVGAERALTFSLSGLSKPAGLPQLKLGWIHLAGPPALVAEAEARLELASDAYLSVATPVQLAAPALLSLCDDVGRQIAARVRAHRAQLGAAVSGTACQLLQAEGGWYAIVRVPATRSEEEWTLRLIEAGVLVHPGYFFEISEPAYLIVSLLPPPATFSDGVGRLLATIASG